MKGSFRVEVREAGGSSGEKYELLLGFGESEKEPAGYLVHGCFSLSAFEREISRLREELLQVVKAARREVERFESRRPAAAVTESAPDIWRRLEQSESDEAMFSLFNSLSEPVRKAVAEYVFSQVSMFKGKGPVFAQHYNALTYRLE